MTRTPYNVLNSFSRSSIAESNSVSCSAAIRMKIREENIGNNPAQGNYIYSGADHRIHMAFGQVPANEGATKYGACGYDGIDSSWDIVRTYPFYQDLTYKITVKTYCNLQTRPLNFNDTTNLNRDQKQSTTVTVDCSSGTEYDVSIGTGLHADGDQRRIYSPVTKQFINYSIKLDKWNGVGSGNPEGDHFQIQGTVPKQETPYPGSYTDTLVVTLTRHLDSD